MQPTAKQRLPHAELHLDAATLRWVAREVIARGRVPEGVDPCNFVHEMAAKVDAARGPLAPKAYELAFANLIAAAEAVRDSEPGAEDWEDLCDAVDAANDHALVSLVEVARAERAGSGSGYGYGDDDGGGVA